MYVNCYNATPFRGNTGRDLHIQSRDSLMVCLKYFTNTYQVTPEKNRHILVNNLEKLVESQTARNRNYHNSTCQFLTESIFDPVEVVGALTVHKFEPLHPNLLNNYIQKLLYQSIDYRYHQILKGNAPLNSNE